MGLVWVKTAANKLVPVRVKTGLTDGSFTAVEGSLKEGDEVVTGIINTQTTTTPQTQQSPFQPQRPGGGRGGR
jgi:HlyD family secretion protein